MDAPRIVLDPSRVGRMLAAAFGVLAAGHLGGAVVVELWRPGHTLHGARRFLSLGQEGNLPTYWTTILLAAAGILLWWLGRVRTHQGRPFGGHFRWLGYGFAFMSMDEAAQFHEGLIGRWLSHGLGNGTGVAHFVWYFAFLPIVVAVGIGYLKFLRHLPPTVARWFIASAALYLGGALGVEMIESVISSNALPRFAIEISQGIEESLEIGGVSYFVYSVTRYLAMEQTPIFVAAEAAPAQPVSHQHAVILGDHHGARVYRRMGPRLGFGPF